MRPFNDLVVRPVLKLQLVMKIPWSYLLEIDCEPCVPFESPKIPKECTSFFGSRQFHLDSPPPRLDVNACNDRVHQDIGKDGYRDAIVV